MGPKDILHFFDHASYIPLKKAAAKIKTWEEQGAGIIYLTSRRKLKEVGEIRDILRKHEFPGKILYFREENKNYKDIVESIMPDILIEDDCASIGGTWQMCITYLKQEIKDKIKSIVVKEFGGIDHLPDSLSDLQSYNP